MGEIKSIPIVYFSSESFVGFRFDEGLLFGNGLCPIEADIVKRVFQLSRSVPSSVVDSASSALGSGPVHF